MSLYNSKEKANIDQEELSASLRQLNDKSTQKLQEYRQEIEVLTEEQEGLK